MSDMTKVPDRPSTPKEGIAETRYSVATTHTAYNEPPTIMHPAELQRHRDVAATGTLPPQDNKTDFFPGSTSIGGLAKLQTYLPTGTWLTYTALETWALNLRPNDPPLTPLSNCNAHQRIALLIVLVLSAAISFFASFIKHFIYDAEGTHVVFPPPDYYRVAESITDSVTQVEFPCRTREGRSCWPLVNASGELVYDESGTRLRVAVFRAGIPVLARPKSRWSCFGRGPAEDDAPLAPRLYPPSQSTPAVTHTPPPPRSLSIDAIAHVPPPLSPRWAHTILGAEGSSAYIDLRRRVWVHAFVSLLAFLALALCSTQVCGCLYPNMPDYLSPPLQTGVLALLAAIAALVVRDSAVSLGQGTMRINAQRSGEEGQVPGYLRCAVEMVVWVGPQDLQG